MTHPYFTPESVKKEQGIIAEEIRMCRDNPYDRCYYNMLDGLYHDHPVKHEICGSVASIKRISAKTLYDCYHTYYRPDNMALVVCGNVTTEQVMAIVNKRISFAKTPQTAHVPVQNEQGSVHRPYVETRGQVAKPVFAIGIKDVEIPTDPTARAKRDAGMAILSEMLFSESGELYNRLLDSGLISPDFSADFAITKDFGFLQISGEADDPRRVLEEILAHLRETREKGLSREDFERCRRVEFAEYIKGFDSPEEIANVLLAFVFDRADLFGYADMLRDMEFSFVESLFDSFFDPAHFTLSVVKPEGNPQEKGD